MKHSISSASLHAFTTIQYEKNTKYISNKYLHKHNAATNKHSYKQFERRSRSYRYFRVNNQFYSILLVFLSADALLTSEGNKQMS